MSEAATQQAIAWCVYLDAHARRVYESVTAGPKVAAARVATEIQAGHLISPFQARQVYRKGWSGLTEREDVDAAIDVLEDLHWLRSVEICPTAKGGRRTTAYQINPFIHGHGPA